MCTRVKVQIFRNPELKKFKFQNWQDAYKMNIIKFKFIVLKIIWKFNPENFHPCVA